MKRISISVPESYDEKLEKEKQASGLAKSDIIRRAVDEYLKNNGHNDEDSEAEIESGTGT